MSVALNQLPDLFVFKIIQCLPDFLYSLLILLRQTVSGQSLQYLLHRRIITALGKLEKPVVGFPKQCLINRRQVTFTFCVPPAAVKAGNSLVLSDSVMRGFPL